MVLTIVRNTNAMLKNVAIAPESIAQPKELPTK